MAMDFSAHFMQGPIPVWMPVPEGIQDTNLAAFMKSFQVRSLCASLQHFSATRPRGLQACL